MNSFTVSSILAATDLSESSLPALRYARLFADRFSAALTVMYSDPVVYPVDYVGVAGSFYIDATPQHQARLRAEVEKHAGPVMEGRSYDIFVTVGQPIAAILAAARDHHADLLVMGTHLRRGWRRALLGSVSDGVLNSSRIPVLTVAVRDQGAGTIPYGVTSILCPVNFTDVARQSLHYASSLAEAFSAHLTVVHVVESNEVTNVKEEEERIRRWAAPEIRSTLSYRELVVRGGAAERVLDCADDIGSDLLVIGAQHRIFRDDTVVGTTTERLIRHASCPVLMVPRDPVRVKREPQVDVELAGVREE